MLIKTFAKKLSYHTCFQTTGPLRRAAVSIQKLYVKLP